MSHMTPSRLDVLLHCYVSPELHPRADAPAVKEDLSILLAAGMIERYDRSYKTTAKGEFYISHLLSIPFPETVFRIPVHV